LDHAHIQHGYVAGEFKHEKIRGSSELKEANDELKKAFVELKEANDELKKNSFCRA
jgi:hypothetical protein